MIELEEAGHRDKASDSKDVKGTRNGQEKDAGSGTGGVIGLGGIAAEVDGVPAL
jgi:hypothetical protein